MKKFITWLQNNWYSLLYLLEFLGLFFYLYIIFLRFIRTIAHKPIVHEDISLLRVYLNIFLAMVFFCFAIILMRTIYKIITKNDKNSSLAKWVQEQSAKISESYKEILKMTLLVIILMLPYYNKFLYFVIVKRHGFACTIMSIFILGISFIVSISFFIDAYKNTYNYFPICVTLLSITLTIKSIWYTFKTISAHLLEGYKEIYDIKTDRYNVISITVKEDTYFYNECLERTNEEVHERIMKDAMTFKPVYQILFTGYIWESYQKSFRLYIMIIRFFSILMFFLGWLIISYNSTLYAYI